MTLTVKAFKEKYNSSTNNKQLEDVLKLLVRHENRSTMSKAKALYIRSLLNLEEKPLSNIIKNPNEEKVLSKTSNNVPYEVQIAKKYTQLYLSSQKRNKEFNLTLKDVHNLLQQKTCYYTGKKFTNQGDLKRTIDRVDNAKGYIIGNVVACTALANQMKEHIFERPTNDTNANIEFIANVAKKVLTHIGQ
jgi:hypothetical protein